MNRNLLGLCILGCSIVSGAANAQTVGQVGYRNITYLVCGKNDTTCAVGITGTPVGPVGCSPGRWAFNATTPAGKVQHA